MSFVSFVSYPPSQEIVKIVLNWGTPLLTKLTKPLCGPRTSAKTYNEAIMQHRNTFESHISLIGGRIRAPRCQALSKRSKLQCRKAALTGKRVCMFHGGKSTGPVTEDGKKRCAIAKTVHGYETRATREYRAKKFREMAALFNSVNW